MGMGDERVAPVNAIGYELDLGSLPSPHPRPGGRAMAPSDAAMPLFVRLRVEWGLVEKSAGTYDWSVLDELIPAHAAAGFALVLSPVQDNPLYAGAEAPAVPAEEAWLSFLRALAGRYGTEVDHYIIGEGLEAMTPREGAYWLKTSAVAIKASDREAMITCGPLDASRPGAASALEGLYQEGVAVYLDGIGFTHPGGPSAAPAVAALKARMLLNAPSARIWWIGRPLDDGGPEAGALLRGYLEGLSQEVAISLFSLGAGPDGMPALMPELDRIRGHFHPSFSPLVESGRGIRIMTPMGQDVPATIVRLFDPDEKKVVIAYDAGPGATRGAQAVMAIDTMDLADPVLLDLAAGESAPLTGYQTDESAGLTRVALPIADYPLVLEYRRFTSPLFGQEEKLEITGQRLPSVDEILAKHQAVQAAQDALLTNLRAGARIDYHFRIGTGSTVDVTVDNRFFFDPAVGAEFEQVGFYVNGVKWRSDRLPEFPLPQPEKVLTLPLDIALDKRYGYRLAGEQTVDGYDCWMIDFDPVGQDRNLYRGRVWIDKKTFARVQISSLQTGLDAPILSNEEKDSYRPVRGPEGITYWLLSRIDGQQVFSTSGRNLVVYREVVFSDHVINDASFESIRKEAYASRHQILRDTPAGQRYLERTPDGGRVVKAEINRDNLFLLGGVFYNRSLDFPVPLAGVNYFNRDLGGSGVQTNVFFGGVLLFANASHPDLFGSGLEGSADLFAQGFSSTDRPVLGGREVESQNVDRIGQSVTLGIGLPFGDYWKVKWTGSLDFLGFSHDEKTDRGFVIPNDTPATTVGMRGDFNRSGWSVAGSIDVTRRDKWGFWGPLDPNVPVAGGGWSAAAKDFVLYQGTVAKEFFLPLNQKIHASVTAFGGTDLDRFSKYRFDFFGNRLRGLAGSGYRFTQGAKAQFQYAFNLGEIIRFEATLDQARVRDGTVPGSPDGDYKSFTGFGLSGQTILGPNLIVSLDWGIAAASDIDEFKGDQEVMVTILRLFR